MGSIVSSFSAALGQIGDPKFRKVLFFGLALTFGLLIAITFGTIWGLNILLPESVSLPFIGEITWLNEVLSGASVLVILGLSVFLMIPVASAFTGIFLDQIADAVEHRHYPSLPAANAIPLGDTLRDTFGFLGLMIGVNLLALILYVIFAPFALFIFWAVNGFLLGREYFQLVAMRRIGRAGAKAARRKHSLTIWAAGILMAIPLTVPILNLVIPILGVATFTHLYHRLEKFS
jgi:CysZ protein